MPADRSVGKRQPAGNAAIAAAPAMVFSIFTPLPKPWESPKKSTSTELPGFVASSRALSHLKPRSSVKTEKEPEAQFALVLTRARNL
jgi:hypothetical protein